MLTASFADRISAGLSSLTAFLLTRSLATLKRVRLNWLGRCRIGLLRSGFGGDARRQRAGSMRSKDAQRIARQQMVLLQCEANPALRLAHGRPLLVGQRP